MRLPKVVMTDYDFLSVDIERGIVEGAGFRFEAFQCKTEEEVIEATRDADGIIVQYATISRRVIEGMERCRIIARNGTGVDIVDAQAATEKGIYVTNIPEYCTDEVADHALMLLLASVRKLLPYYLGVKRGRWGWTVAQPVMGLRGRTLGLVGFGKIARNIAGKAKAFGLLIQAYDPYLPEEVFAEHGVKQVPFEELLQTSDALIIQAPLTKETYHLFGEKEFRLMKPHAVLVNTARGPIVDEAALYRALKEGWISAAAQDDLECEPAKLKEWRPESPLLELENFLVTPHIAWYSEEARLKAQRGAAEEVVRVLKGERPRHLVNPEVLKILGIKGEGEKP